MRNKEAPVGAWRKVRNRGRLYIPHGIAHGCRSLENEIGISCRMSTLHNPEAAAGVHWGGPAFAARRRSNVGAVAARGRYSFDFALS